MVFRPDQVLSIKDLNFQNFDIRYLSASKEIRVQVPQSWNISNARLYNMLGQKVSVWSGASLRAAQQGLLHIPIERRLDEGLYIFKLETDRGSQQLKFLYEE